MIDRLFANGVARFDVNAVSDEAPGEYCEALRTEIAAIYANRGEEISDQELDRVTEFGIANWASPRIVEGF